MRKRKASKRLIIKNPFGDENAILKKSTVKMADADAANSGVVSRN